MKVRKSNQAGKGDQLRKGANLEAYWNNYDNIFPRKCKPTTQTCCAKPSPSSPDAGTARAE